MASRAHNPLPEDDSESEDEGLSLHDIKEIAGFILRAPRRRPKLAIAALVVTAGLGIAAAVTMPNTYNSQVKLLAQQNLVVPALTNPGRSVPREADNPTNNVADEILRRDNLVQLAKETNLADRYYAGRSAPLKLKDKLLSGQMSEEDKVKIVVATLESKVSVKAEDNNVTISVDWYQPDVAFDLVSKLQENFQSARYDTDVSMINDAITVLQQHAKEEAEAVDANLEEYRKAAAEFGSTNVESAPVDPKAPAATVVVHRRASAPSVAHPVPASLSPEVADALEAKRTQIRALEESRAKQLETLRQQLAQAQLTLTPQHPTVIALQQKIDGLSEPDPQLAALKAEERALLSSIAPPPEATSPGTPTTYTTTTTLLPAAPLKKEESTLGTAREDPKVALQRAKLDGAIRRYQDAVSRIDTANVELEVARSAFKYRYTVVTPPEAANKPKKPMKTIVGVGSVVGSILLAFLIAAGADMASGRVIEEWQVRRRLKLEVLGDFDPSRPQLPAEGYLSDDRSRALALRQPSRVQNWDDVPLQKLWLATQKREWRSLALVAAGKDVDTLPIAELLAHAAWAYSGRPSCVFDLRDLSLRLAEFQMREVAAQIHEGTRVVIALRSVGENPTAVPVARNVDAAVLCIGLGGTRIAQAERALQEIGRDRVIGSIVVRSPDEKKK